MKRPLAGGAAALCLLLLAGAAPPPEIAGPATAPGGTPIAAAPLPAGPANLDFEAGDLHLLPPGWSMTADSELAGFGAELTDDQPYEGLFCALVHTVAMHRNQGGSGTLVQLFDATAYRGRQVRFRAAVRVEPNMATHARLFLAVQRPGGQAGFFDNMADRPITASGWQLYEVSGEVAPDASRIGIGMTVTGEGRAWIDGGSFTALGPASSGRGAAAAAHRPEPGKPRRPGPSGRLRALLPS